MENDQRSFLDKARESLASAEDDFDLGRYNSCANRCYYACFQAAVAALIHDGIRPTKIWRHEFVQVQFVGQLFHRRKRYPSDLRHGLINTFKLRQIADYRSTSIQHTQASRALNQTRAFLTAIEERVNA